MRGMIFRSFQEYAAERYGERLVDDLLAMDALTVSGGAYTSVGTYPHSEFVAMAQEASARTGEPMDGMVKDFGRVLFARLASSHQAMMAGFHGCFDFLANLESVVHRDVRKLYDTDEVPYFQVVDRDGDVELVLRYSSSRPFADLAEGLLLGALVHYGLEERVMVARRNLTDDNTQAEFKLTRHGSSSPNL